MDLTYCEQRVQETFELLLVLHNNEKVKADLFLRKAWQSYWHRMELNNWFKRIRRG